VAGIEVIEQADAASLAVFDMLIDVRSPSEFAEDHVPGAVNLPVLDDAERAEVGTIYVQESRFRARRVGAALIARNVARHLDTVLADRPGGFRPLVYCWRGGQRSNAMATILSQVGWRTAMLAGGYRTYRRYVQHRLYEGRFAGQVVLLDGGTGCGKTEVLGLLADRGMQVLDLEALAGHRGSLFGGLGAPQPSQKMFETRLLSALDRLDPDRPVVVEAESSKIGDRMVPPALWQAMAAAPRIELRAPREARARYLVRAYREIIEDRPALEEAFRRLPVYPARERLDNWRRLADAGNFEALAETLIELHYDPAYARSAKKDGRRKLGVVEVADLGAADLARAADQVLQLAKEAAVPA
jgi:tRNA 2-selenouridine synthase